MLVPRTYFRRRGAQYSRVGWKSYLKEEPLETMAICITQPNRRTPPIYPYGSTRSFNPCRSTPPLYPHRSTPPIYPYRSTPPIYRYSSIPPIYRYGSTPPISPYREPPPIYPCRCAPSTYPCRCTLPSCPCRSTPPIYPGPSTPHRNSSSAINLPDMCEPAVYLAMVLSGVWDSVLDSARLAIFHTQIPL